MSPEYRIAPIDLLAHADICIAFRTSSYVASFGTTEGLEQAMGPQGARYLSRLAERCAKVPHGNAHLWHCGQIIGQTEMNLVDDPSIGYVNLFFIAPAFRGRGTGRLLHEHACRVFAALGKQKLQLSVSPSNASALAFYRKHGWTNLGPRPGREKMWLMEHALAPTDFAAASGVDDVAGP